MCALQAGAGVPSESQHRAALTVPFAPVGMSWREAELCISSNHIAVITMSSPSVLCFHQLSYIADAHPVPHAERTQEQRINTCSVCTVFLAWHPSQVFTTNTSGCMCINVDESPSKCLVVEIPVQKLYIFS